MAGQLAGKSPSRLQLTGLSGAQDTFVLAATFLQKPLKKMDRFMLGPVKGTSNLTKRI